MTAAHLPECIYTPEWFDPEQNIIWDGKPCICDRLRACEQRVLSVAGPHNYSRGRKDGYANGVQAARDAVAAASLRIPYEDRRHVYLDDALAAIDALRGEPNE